MKRHQFLRDLRPTPARCLPAFLLLYATFLVLVAGSRSSAYAGSVSDTFAQPVRLHADLQNLPTAPPGPSLQEPRSSSLEGSGSSSFTAASGTRSAPAQTTTNEGSVPRTLLTQPPAVRPPLPDGSPQDSPETSRLDLLVGDAIVVPTKGMYRVSVGNAKAIQVVAIDRSQLLLIGETPGFSKIHVWEHGGMRSMDVLVTSSVLERLELEANAARDRNSALSVRREADRVIVRGQAISAAERARFAELARKYPELILLAHGNSVEATVVVDLFFVEVKTERLKQLGIRWAPGAQGPSASVSVDRFNPLHWTLGLAAQFTSMLQFLQNDGDAVLLARPTLTAKAGGSARFVAGGELPIPVSSALGQGSVLFKEYGVRIEIAPTIASADILNLRLTAEISSINFEAQVKDIPGIAKRRTESEVQVRSGDTLVVAGLISDDVAKSFERLPGIGDVPGIGGLFRSRQFRDRNSELLLFVSPRLVNNVSEAALGSAQESLAARSRMSR